MSEEIEDEQPASSEELSEIDDILEEAMPEFVQELKSIKAENLNDQEIGLPTEAEVAQKDRWYYRFWFGLDRKIQIAVVLGGFLLFIGLPLFLLSMFGLLTPAFLVAGETSLAPLADEKIQLEASHKPKDLMHLFLTDQFFLEIPEQVFPLKPKADIRVARFGFYLELLDREHAAFFNNHYEEIIEILSRTLKLHTFEDFRGSEGKEEMRKVLLVAINSKLDVKIKNVRYKLVVF